MTAAPTPAAEPQPAELDRAELQELVEHLRGDLPLWKWQREILVAAVDALLAARRESDNDLAARAASGGPGSPFKRQWSSPLSREWAAGYQAGSRDRERRLFRELRLPPPESE